VRFLSAPSNNLGNTLQHAATREKKTSTCIVPKWLRHFIFYIHRCGGDWVSNQRRWKVFSYKVGGFPWYIYREFDVFEFAMYLKLGVIYLDLAAMYSSFWQNTKLHVFEMGKGRGCAFSMMWILRNLREVLASVSNNNVYPILRVPLKASLSLVRSKRGLQNFLGTTKRMFKFA